MFPTKPYKRTDAGNALLKKYEWIPYIHSHNIIDLDIWNLTTKVQTPPYTSYRDKIWCHFNEIGLAYAQKGQFGFYRTIRFQMSEFLMEESREKDAFCLLCEVVAYDLSGLNNGPSLQLQLQFMPNNYKLFFPYDHSIVTMAPGITERLKKLRDSFSWSDIELTQNLQQYISEITLPFSIFTADEKVHIVLAEMNQDKVTLDTIYTVGAKRFKKQFKIK